MFILSTPGVYRQPLEPARSAARVARGDIAVLLGYSRRGPVGQPVRVRSVRQFEEVFGSPPAAGYLAHAVKGFFETGGQAAYVMRVATARARVAAVDLPRAAPDPLAAGPTTAAADDVTWRAEASFPWLMIDPRRLRGAESTEAHSWLQVFERQLLTGRRSPDPGAWGNGLAVRVVRTSRVRTETVPEAIGDGTSLRLVSTAAVEDASVLELTQESSPARVWRVPLAVDRARRLVHLGAGRGPAGLRLDRPIRVTSVEFDVSVLRDGRPEETFSALAPRPGHSRSIGAVMEAECRSLGLRPVTAADPAGVDWAVPGRWPVEGTHALGGGTDGLDDDGITDAWLAVLREVAALDDAALVAAPDLVLPAVAPAPATGATPREVDCADLEPRPLGHLSGTVETVTPDGAVGPVAGVEVDVAGQGVSGETDAEGRFALFGLEVGLLTVRLRAPGYEPLETLLQSSPFASAAPVRLTLTPIITPRALLPDEVLRVQQAMADAALVGPYKIAVLDAPAARSRLDEIATWRSRLGDSSRMGFFAPWLTLPVLDGTGRHVTCPPSGHVCGAFAAGELAIGIHRTGANLRLRHVDGTTLTVTDEEQAGLNPVGINVIRAFPGRGIRVFGSRTLSSDPQWRFLTTRRVVDAIEKTLERELQWMVFEPNNLLTRQSVTATATTLLGTAHRDGILAGSFPDGAFSVRCDEENNPDAVQDAGGLVVDVAVAPTEPYEFVLFRLGRSYDALDVTEASS